jgi:hypothetical protein
METKEKEALAKLEALDTERRTEALKWSCNEKVNRAKIRRMDAEIRRLAIKACGMAAEIGTAPAERYAASTGELCAWARERFEA